MNRQVYGRKSISIAVVSALELAAPSVITMISLYALTQILDVVYNQYFLALTILAGLLSLFMLRPERDATFVSNLGPLSLGLRLVVRWLAVLSLLLAIGYVTKFSAEFARRVILTWSVITPVLIWIAMLFIARLLRSLYVSKRNMRTAIITGFTESSQSLAEKLKTHPELGIRSLGFFDDRGPERLGMKRNGQMHLGCLQDMAEYVRTHSIDMVFIALPIRQIKRIMNRMDDLRNSTASIYYVPDVFVFDLIQSRTAEFMGIPVVAMCETPFHGYRGALKRALDLTVTVAALIVLAPLLLIIAALVKLSSPGPIIFKQRRYGLDGKEIQVYKFRSMTVTEDGHEVVQATREDERVTPVGRFLRRYSLDELPQLFNVLEGTMSLVGPRPHAVAHNEQYRRMIKGYMVRHKVLPGITGLAQVNGCRGETEKLEQMESRVRYDTDYLRHWSPLLDLKILAKTALSLVRPDKHAY